MSAGNAWTRAGGAWTQAVDSFLNWLTDLAIRLGTAVLVQFVGGPDAPWDEAA